jgi:hypothetical protein
MDMRRVIVTIDRLALRGVDPGDQGALIRALKSELARTLLGPGGGLDEARSRSVSAVRSGPIMAEPGRAGARALGAAAARTIGKEVGR